MCFDNSQKHSSSSRIQVSVFPVKGARSTNVRSGTFRWVKDEEFLRGYGAQSIATFVVTKCGRPVTDTTRLEALMKTDLRGSAFVRMLWSDGLELTFKGFESDVFTYNLRMIDALMPQLLGAMVIEACRIEGEAPTVAAVIDWVSQDAVAKRHAVLGQLGKAARQRKAVLTYKMKKFLMALALGMRADESWDGIERMPEAWAGQVLDRRTVEDDLVRRVRLNLGVEEEYIRGLFVNEEGVLCIKAQLSIIVK